MVTLRKYQCNFCRKELAAEDDVQGMKWIEGNMLMLADASQVENHLCHECLKAIGDVAMSAGLIKPKLPVG